MGWSRKLFLVPAVVAAFVVLLAAPALAQLEPAPADGVVVVEETEGAQATTTQVLDEDTSAVVNRIRRDLIVISVVTAAGLIAYVWHTSPSRRLRSASARVQDVQRAPTD